MRMGIRMGVSGWSDGYPDGIRTIRMVIFSKAPNGRDTAKRLRLCALNHVIFNGMDIFNIDTHALSRGKCHTLVAARLSYLPAEPRQKHALWLNTRSAELSFFAH